jgi:hypothetical protein
MRASVGGAVCAGQQQQQQQMSVVKDWKQLHSASLRRRDVYGCGGTWPSWSMPTYLGHIVSAALKSSTNRRAGHERLSRQPSSDD